MKSIDLSLYQKRARALITLGLFFTLSIAGLITQRQVAQAQAPGNDLLISEFRFRGVGGGTDPFEDEFIELYNNTNADLNITATDASAGWSVAYFNPSDSSVNIVFTIPNGTIIPARGHYLAVGQNYTLNTYPGGTTRAATADFTYAIDIPDNAGIAIFRTANPANFDSGTRVDSAGFGDVTNALFKEGSGLTPSGGISRYVSVDEGTATENFSFVRLMPTNNGLPIDTGNNEADFLLVSPTSLTVTDENVNQRTPILGAPGPENLDAPIQRNTQIPATLLDPSAPQTAPPNRLRDPSDVSIPNAALVAQYGSLTIRRTFTNNTGSDITRLRFRIIDITTLNSPGYAADPGNTGAGQADIRLFDSADDPAVIVNGVPVEVKGVRLEKSAGQAQLRGGGMNASAWVFTLNTLPGGVLADGQSINVQFKYGVQIRGRFRIYVNVEAETAPNVAASPVRSPRPNPRQGNGLSPARQR